MAKAKVVHSDDAVKVIFKGDVRNPEPALGVIEFPGGHIEVSRCSDGSYYAHLSVVDSKNIVASRMDYDADVSYEIGSIPDVPMANRINHVAIRIANNVPRFDPDSAA